MDAPSWSTFEDESLGETTDHGCAEDGDDILHVLGEVDVQGGRPNSSRLAAVPASWPCPLPDPGANAPATKDAVAVGDEGDVVQGVARARSGGSCAARQPLGQGALVHASGGHQAQQPEAHADASRHANEILPCEHATGRTAVAVASSAPGAGASHHRCRGGGGRGCASLRGDESGTPARREEHA